MCPIAPAGTTGYPDWQRIQNWDSPSLFSHTVPFVGDSDGSGVLDVSRFGYMLIIDKQTGGPTFIEVDALWFEDSHGTVGLGEITWFLDGQMSNTAVYHLPNLGPFFKIVWNRFGGANGMTHTCNVVATNRFHQLQEIPSTSLLINSNGVNVAGGGQEILFPTTSFTGPARLHVNTASPTWAVEMQSLTSSASMVTTDEITQGTAAEGTTVNIPLGSFQLRVSNLDAAAHNFDVRLTPIWTGAF